MTRRARTRSACTFIGQTRGVTGTYVLPGEVLIRQVGLRRTTEPTSWLRRPGIGATQEQQLEALYVAGYTAYPIEGTKIQRWETPGERYSWRRRVEDFFFGSGALLRATALGLAVDSPPPGYPL